jgi:hypothetical protein
MRGWRVVEGDAAAPAADPHQAGTVYQQRTDTVVADAGGAGAVVMQPVHHGQAGAVHHIDALAEGTQPDFTGHRFGDAVDPEVAQAVQRAHAAAGGIEHGGALARTADPDAALAVLEQAGGIGGTERRREPAIAKPALHAGLARHPQAALAVEQDRAQLVAGQAGAIAFDMAVVAEPAAGRIEQRQAVVGGQPQHSVGQFRDAFDAVVGQAFLAARIVTVLVEAFGARIEQRQAAADGADPQPAVAPRMQGADIAAAQCRRVAGTGTEYLVTIAVVAHQAVLGADPQQALRVLHHRRAQMGRHLVRHGDALERHQARPLLRRCHSARGQQAGEQA